jgi:ATP-dependent RNA helicase HelY
VRPPRHELTASYEFALDPFQVRAFDALDAGRSVLVAAPTGSGKTVVAEYAIAAAIAQGQRAFYTAPIKALSNQKFNDLRARHGDEQVGLLTGDNSVNSDAPIVVMTTEVLRNMIYARSSALARLGVVVLDEVHFIQDAYRGPVWEEVIIHLDPAVTLVCLSATVSNAGELAEWITTVRGPTDAIVEERRPVELENLYMVGDRTSDRIHMMPTLVRGRPNQEAARLDDEAARGWKGGGVRHRVRRKLYTPARLDVIDRLDRDDMLPAIYFIFSRNACDDAALHCLNANVRLTTAEERDRIRVIADERLGLLETQDLAVLGYATFIAELENGIAAHHAGMVPPFKEVVEACFVEGLVKVVFATETLAVGINMPARTVVIEKLTKFTGDHHAPLTPAEYTQLTGRAGRRGIDTLGHAVVLWSPFVPFDQVAALASSRSFHLRSAFRPTYNMAANLVQAYTADEAHHLLNLSFAQFQADGDLVRLEARIERRQHHLDGLTAAARSPFGDIDEYRASRGARARPSPARQEIEEALAMLRPGEVIYIEVNGYAGRAAVVSIAQRSSGVKVVVVTPTRDAPSLTAKDFDEPPRPVGSIDLPVPYAPNRQEFRRNVASRLERMAIGAKKAPARRSGRDDAGPVAHPVERDPDLRDRLRAAAQAERVAREIDDLRRQAASRSRSVARQFDVVLGILRRRGYVEGWTLTSAGRILARLFHECDLLVAECVREGLLDGLDPAAMAGLVSVFTYEHRSPEAPPAPWYPSSAVRKRFLRISAISAELRDEEEWAGYSVHRAPDPTFLAVAYAWAAGEGFAEVIADEELSGGDFVRNMKLLIDLLRQLALVAPNTTTRQCADQAADRLFRGVVSASSVLADDEIPEPVVVSAEQE